MRIKHYLICSVRIIKRDTIKLSKYVSYCFRLVFSVIKCIFLVTKRTDTSVTCDHSPLEYYYPDKGHLSNSRCFKFEQCSLDLSIIIPVYNVANYIEECLNSVLSQKTNYSYEVIIVDDGSTDDTMSLVEPYCQDERMVILNQSNSGQSVARNRAIDISRGRYIMFVDSDDVLLPGAVEALINAAVSTNSEIAEGSIIRFSERFPSIAVSESEEIVEIKAYSTDPRFVLTSYGYSWAKVYSRELWNTLRFPEGYIFEDIITKYILRRKANQVVYIKNAVYGYRFNHTSSSHGKNHLKKLDSIWVLPRVFELCKYAEAPRDDIFYILALNNIGLLNYITTKPHSVDIQLACFAEMRKQLLSIQDCKPQKIPLLFCLLDRAIIDNRFDAWKYIAETMNKFNMLKKWREIN